MKHPGQVLLDDFLKPLDITPYALAKGIGVHVSRITRIIKGERPVTVDTAVRLGHFFQVPPRWWLDLQVRYDLANEDLSAKLAAKVTPYDKLNEVVVTPTGARRLTAPRPRAAPVVLTTDDLLQRLSARAAPTKATPRTGSREVEYPNGFRALVGE